MLIYDALILIGIATFFLGLGWYVIKVTGYTQRQTIRSSGKGSSIRQTAMFSDNGSHVIQTNCTTGGHMAGRDLTITTGSGGDGSFSGRCKYCGAAQ